MSENGDIPTWVRDLITEARRDIDAGLDHSMYNAPVRVRRARDAVDRLVAAVERLARVNKVRRDGRGGNDE